MYILDEKKDRKHNENAAADDVNVKTLTKQQEAIICDGLPSLFD